MFPLGEACLEHVGDLFPALALDRELRRMDGDPLIVKFRRLLDLSEHVQGSRAEIFTVFIVA